MAKEKQYVFSARTTEEGLKALNEVKARGNMGWDELVIEAMCAHYGLDRAVMALPKKEAPMKETQDNEQPPADQTIEERPLDAGEEKPTSKRKKGGKS